jgi:hypothetical protein
VAGVIKVSAVGGSAGTGAAREIGRDEPFGRASSRYSGFG